MLFYNPDDPKDLLRHLKCAIARKSDTISQKLGRPSRRTFWIPFAMTIVYLLRYYPTLTETFVYQEIKALLDKGLNIEIISMGFREDGRLADQSPKCHRAQCRVRIVFDCTQNSALASTFSCNTNGQKTSHGTVG